MPQILLPFASPAHASIMIIQRSGSILRGSCQLSSSRHGLERIQYGETGLSQGVSRVSLHSYTRQQRAQRKC